MANLVELRNVFKIYGEGLESEVRALDGVSLTIDRGELVAVVGQSGSGKSTLLYALSGMDRATAGEIIYQDSNLAAISEKKLAELRHTDFGFIFQQIHLVSNLSLFENIVVPGYLNKQSSASEINARANSLLEQVGISHVKTHLPSQVSGGEQQRCAIARAIIHQPKLLFADEPTGALNRRNTTEVLNLLTDLNTRGQSILMVTHDMRAALRAGRILYLADGAIIGELSLPPYSAEEEKSREVQVNAWLNSMEW